MSPPDSWTWGSKRTQHYLMQIIWRESVFAYPYIHDDFDPDRNQVSYPTHRTRKLPCQSSLRRVDDTNVPNRASQRSGSVAVRVGWLGCC